MCNSRWFGAFRRPGHAAPLFLQRLFVGFLVLLEVMMPVSDPVKAATPVTAHEFIFENIEGGPLPLAEFKGKIVLLVNTASQCGFTPQYEGLQRLWEAYRERGLVVLGVPSDDFGGQEPGNASQIKTFCEVTFGIDFPMTDKVRIKGPDAHPYYQWVATQGMLKVPRWNFHKHLIDGDGNLVDWFASTTKPDSAKLIAAIEKQLAQ